MKVVGIGGSARRGGLTERILGEILGALSAVGHETEAIWVASEKINGCVACLKCEKTGTCAQVGDRADEILNRIIPSAGLMVVASPLYFSSIPWKLKALVDRVQLCWARRVKLGGKQLDRGVSAIILVGGSSPEKHFDGPARVLRAALKELGYPCKAACVLANADKRAGEIEGFIEEAKKEVVSLAEGRTGKG